MRIAQIAPLAESVPPRLYGGTERVVAWLVDELCALGHEVTLFATGDSDTRAELIETWPRALRLGRPAADPMSATASLLEQIVRHARSFEIVHSHIDWVHLSLLSRMGVPHVTTLHGRLDFPGLPAVIKSFPNAPFVSISDNQRIPLAQARWVGTVYHGLPAQSLTPCFEPGKYLAFLGRLSSDKGPEAAIRIAKGAGMPLHLAAKVPKGERSYFAKHIAPLVDDHAVRLTGEVDDKTKERFLRDAAALLFPIDWPEPFGLVMIEAMACGTPVIAFPKGSVPEIIEHAVTGFIVRTEDEAIAAAKRIGQLDRRRVRAEFERRFTARHMAEQYVGLYRSLIEQHRRQTPVGLLSEAS